MGFSCFLNYRVVKRYDTKLRFNAFYINVVKKFEFKFFVFDRVIIPDFESVYACFRFKVNENTTTVPTTSTGNALVMTTTTMAMTTGNQFFVLVRISLTMILFRNLLGF